MYAFGVVQAAQVWTVKQTTKGALYIGTTLFFTFHSEPALNDLCDSKFISLRKSIAAMFLVCPEREFGVWLQVWTQFPTSPSTPGPVVDEVPAEGLPDHGVTDVGAPREDGRAKRDLEEWIRFYS